MNLEPITTVDRNDARQAFLEYRDAFRHGADELDAELMRGYKALADGKQLIRLSQAIVAGGLDGEGRPKLAIARADEQTITFSRFGRRIIMAPSDRVRSADRRFIINAFPAISDNIWMGTWEARLPIIPPRFRPTTQMVGFHLLWEAEWYRARTGVRAPRDPALLKRIGGDLFAVLAVWDLTDLERAVLEMRG